jgi:hypothetical protein
LLSDDVVELRRRLVSTAEERWHRVVREPLFLEGVRPRSERVETVLFSLLEPVLGSVHEQARVAVELRGWNVQEGRREAVEVVASIASVAEDDFFGVVVVGADLAGLQQSPSVVFIGR